MHIITTMLMITVMQVITIKSCFYSIMYHDRHHNHVDLQVWAGFAMIIVASYTANLAAFLVLDKPQTSNENNDDGDNDYGDDDDDDGNDDDKDDDDAQA